jgi:hypothetical protein
MNMPANTLNVGLVINPLIYWEHPAGSTNQIYIDMRIKIAQLPGPIEHVVFAGPRSQYHWIWPLFHHYANPAYQHYSAQPPGSPPTHYSQIPNTHKVDNYQNTHMISAKPMDHSHPSNFPPKYIPSTSPPISTPYGLVDPGWEYRQIDRMFAYRPHPIKALIVIDPSWCNPLGPVGRTSAQPLQYAMVGAQTRGLPIHLVT